MTEHHDHREVGTLTAADLGKPVRVEWEGWTHTGTLEEAEHARSAIRDTARTFVIIKAENGSRWMKHLPTDHPITVRVEEEAT